MLRIPPALWLLGLAVGVSLLTREPAPRAGSAALARKAPAVAHAPKVVGLTGPAAPAR